MASRRRLRNCRHKARLVRKVTSRPNAIAGMKTCVAVLPFRGRDTQYGRQTPQKKSAADSWKRLEARGCKPHGDRISHIQKMFTFVCHRNTQQQVCPNPPLACVWQKKMFLKVPAMLLLTHTPPVSHSPHRLNPTLSPPLPPLRGVGPRALRRGMRAGAGPSAKFRNTNVNARAILSFCFVAPAS